EEAEAHGGKRGGAEEEGVEGELVDRGIADRAREAQGHEHGGEGGAEGLLVRAARIEVHREEDRGHRAEEGADGAGEEARERAEHGGRNRRGAAGGPGRHPQGIDRVQDDEGAERSSEEHGVERLEEEQAGRDAEGASGQEPEELPLGDVLAVAADDRGGGGDADQRPGRRQDLHRDDEREERQADRRSPADVRGEFGRASMLRDGRVVFNIAGNKYRLVVWINYPYRVVYVRFIGTHSQYDRIDAQTI